MRWQIVGETLRPVHVRGMQVVLQAVGEEEPDLLVQGEPPVPGGSAPQEPVSVLQAEEVHRDRHETRRLVDCLVCWVGCFLTTWVYKKKIYALFWSLVFSSSFSLIFISQHSNLNRKVYLQSQYHIIRVRAH